MPRFMWAAIPYYCSVFLTMGGFLVFVLLLMFSKSHSQSLNKSKPKNE